MDDGHRWSQSVERGSHWPRIQGPRTVKESVESLEWYTWYNYKQWVQEAIDRGDDRFFTLLNEVRVSNTVQGNKTIYTYLNYTLMTN